jgi:zinc protease
MIALLISTLLSSAPPELAFERYQLKNGLTVILHVAPRRPVVAVQVRYDVGALHETKGRSGFAHLFEHMMFQGSAHVPPDRHMAILSERGGRSINGLTSFDETRYIETVPAEELELALWLESDRMGFLLEAIDEKSLANQKDVVVNERRERVTDEPYGLIDELIIRTLFPEPHPYYGNVIGSTEDIKNATLDDVRAFFRKYYTPANATLTLAGDLDVRETKLWIEKYFGSLRGGPKPAAPELEPLKIKRGVALRANEPVARQPRITFVWAGPAPGDPGSAELDILSRVLASEHSTVLGSHLAAYGYTVDEASAALHEHAGGSYFRIDVVLKAGTNLEDVDRHLSELVELMRRLSLFEAVESAYTDLETDLIFSLQKMDTRAEVLSTYNAVFGDPGRLAWDLKRYKSVTPEGVLEAVRIFLGSKNKVVVYAEPTSERIRSKR